MRTSPRITTVAQAAAELERLCACEVAKEWFNAYNWPDALAAWAACPMPGWMTWLATARGVDPSIVTTASVACSRLPWEDKDGRGHVFTSELMLYGVVSCTHRDLAKADKIRELIPWEEIARPRRLP